MFLKLWFVRKNTCTSKFDDKLDCSLFEIAYAAFQNVISHIECWVQKTYIQNFCAHYSRFIFLESDSAIDMDDD